MDSTSENGVTKTVEVEGIPFAYREAGPATGIPVVFLHHFTAVLDDWDPAKDRDAPVSNETIGAQITALAKWEQGTSPAGLTNVDKPVLVVNGDDDTMLPTSSSLHLAQLLPDPQLSIYPDSGHGGIFQHHDLFVAQALEFLRD